MSKSDRSITCDKNGHLSMYAFVDSITSMFHRQNIVIINDLCDHTWQLDPETWPGYFEVLDSCTVVGTTSGVSSIHSFPDRKPVYFGTFV